MKICVVGGGPGGLFFARLLKRSRPQDHVEVREQNAPDATFGFGVSISMAARDRMREYDPHVYDALAEQSLFNNQQEITLNKDAMVLEYPSGGGAIRRLDLLAVLSRMCREVGVTLTHHTRVESIANLMSEFDLVVAADGANSAIRSHFAEAFDVVEVERSNHFAWFGLDRAMSSPGLEFIDTPYGPFVGHYYAYSATRSTFVPECDDVTWRASGLETMNDAERKSFVERLFAQRLGGLTLAENKSIWRTFRATHARRWHHHNIALMGDALRVAHYSLGSGTRLAMEDAMALHDAVITHPGNVPAALAMYEQTRRPVRETFGDAAERSIDWYEDMRGQVRRPLIELIYSFLTRTGRISDDRMATYAPAFHRQWVAHLAARDRAAETTQSLPTV